MVMTIHGQCWIVTFSGPGITIARTGFLFSLTWRGLTVYYRTRRHKYLNAWAWLPRS